MGRDYFSATMTVQPGSEKPINDRCRDASRNESATNECAVTNNSRVLFLTRRYVRREIVTLTAESALYICRGLFVRKAVSTEIKVGAAANAIDIN